MSSRHTFYPYPTKTKKLSNIILRTIQCRIHIIREFIIITLLFGVELQSKFFQYCQRSGFLMTDRQKDRLTKTASCKIIQAYLPNNIAVTLSLCSDL